eukprot:gene8645-10656_t
MGGDLQLIPSLTGAEFRLRLALLVLPKFSPVSEHHEPAPRTPNAVPAGLCVLVVDDIATNRLVAKAHLHLHGIKTEEADSGAEALARLRQNGIDLVLLDMNMPGMDGIETLQRIRALPGRTRLPVIAMTADATEAHRRRYLAAGMDGYLAKPLTPESVAEMLALYAPAAR